MEIIFRLQEIQSIFDKIDKIPIGCCVLNGGVTFCVAFLSLPTYSKDLIISRLKSFQDIVDVTRHRYTDYFHYWRYIFALSLLTGIASAALLASQKSHISLPTAIAYGFAGPFLLKKKMLELAGSKEIGKLSVGVGEVVEIESKDYEKELKKIKSELDKLGKN